MKKLLKHEKFKKTLTKVASFILFLYLQLVLKTSRVKVHVTPAFASAVSKGSVIFCFWHGRLLAAIVGRKSINRVAVLISRGADAELLVVLLKLLKVEIIRGSTNRGGAEKGGAGSLKTMMERLKKEKTHIALAPDGPVGPNMQATPGVALLSMNTQTPIIGATLNASPAVRFSSWDRFLFLLPFSKIDVSFSDPIIPPKDGETLGYENTVEDESSSYIKNKMQSKQKRTAVANYLSHIQQVLTDLTVKADVKFKQK